MKRIYHYIMPVLALGMLSACSSDGDHGSNEYIPIELTGQSRATSERLNDFYTNFTSDMADFVDASQGGNFVVSPLSLSMVLSMMGNAVDGELRNEITDYLGVNSLDEMNELASTLLATLPKIDKKSDLTLANSVWVNGRYTLNSDFSKLMTDSYRCDLGYFDIAKIAQSASEINKWIASKTGGEITNFIRDNDIDQSMMLMLNTLLFKSEWATPELFPESNTKNYWFKGANSSRQVPTMVSKETTMLCYFDVDYSYLSVLFGNAAFKFEILLPSNDMSLDFLTSTARNKLDEARESSTGYTRATLQMPKFSLEYETDLNEALMAAGLKHLKDDVAITSLTDEDKSGKIEFRQKVKLDVDEKGAKAVVVSSGNGMLTSPGDPSEPVRINVDHPFMFFITERSTGAMIVSGRITDL